MTISKSLFLVVCAILFISTAQGYTTPSSPSIKAQQSSSTTSTSAQPINRLSFLKTAFASSTLILTNANAAQAKDIDPALKGTKQDPAYQACLSKCVYDCTKPKGDEQKTRSECLPECKVKCATNKEQLLLGSPIKN
jgi:hypothetical protein